MGYDAVIVGSGPNGLSAAIELQSKGLSTIILESQDSPGGGMRSSELMTSGFVHDHCGAVLPMAYLSPFIKSLPLKQFGLTWIFPEASVAHPLDDQSAVMLYDSLEKTLANIDPVDRKAWQSFMTPFEGSVDKLLADSLAPLKIPSSPLLMMKFGMKAMLSANAFMKYKFQGIRAKALFSGNAAHGIMPFNYAFSSAIGLLFSVLGNELNWPIVQGGTQKLTDALVQYYLSLGGKIQCNSHIHDWKELPSAKKYLFDVDPKQLAKICQHQLSSSYLKKLNKYNFGPGVFKIDWVLNEAIPWSDKNVLKASTVHLGGRHDDIAKWEQQAWKGILGHSPTVILCQQSQFDSTRVQGSGHTGYAYCHVPNNSEVDCVSIIENQIERFAPGFKDVIEERYTWNCKQLYHYNNNFVGGAITGGAATFNQLFHRPVSAISPYKTSNKDIFICSASSPPGGGVHGMCGYNAAKAVLKYF